jgi:hypothetical protein
VEHILVQVRFGSDNSGNYTVRKNWEKLDFEKEKERIHWQVEDNWNHNGSHWIFERDFVGLAKGKKFSGYFERNLDSEMGTKFWEKTTDFVLLELGDFAS